MIHHLSSHQVRSRKLPRPTAPHGQAGKTASFPHPDIESVIYRSLIEWGEGGKGGVGDDTAKNASTG
ncbi:uncharacterized protein BO66DRAFT_136700 [Aspergillus aculeatinus CBS 121060]|uniref:Uncharacterized protein n=1 Tax=Aspergillus aculeatinus CBS 121060 TaxID=1448322 RepID=A0ACD1H3J5_9EURO|nr:hypothetical protein BO66DRAFT_136700 [Aspergillus aculeatinus CBS 121060]RAH67953.1 hypothetical protein BO66DRAFT_136700 [Aspergillus aculeatinus CBS 121060]